MNSKLRSGLVRGGVTAGSLLLIAAGVAGFGGVVHSTPAPEVQGPGREPLLVTTASVDFEESYTVTRSFAGRIEARQSSSLGFEISGAVERIEFDEGELVGKGEVVAVLNDDLLLARRGELIAERDRARAGLELAELTVDRLERARTLNATSQQEFDEADKSRAEAAAVVARADAAVASIDVEIGKAVLRSPFDAVVSVRCVDSGVVVNAGAPVVRLLERRNPRARIGVAGRSVGSLAAGQAVTVDVDGRPFDGVVSSVLPTRDAGARSVDVVIELDAQLNGLREGDLARLDVERAVDSRGFWVPMRSLTEGARGLWSLYTLHEDADDADDAGTTRLLQSNVEVLHVEADRAFVRGPVAPGARFVSTGLHRVAPGMVVRADVDALPSGDETARVAP